MYQILRKGLLAAVVAELKSQSNEHLCKPSELPLYSNKGDTKINTKSVVEEKPGQIESTIREVRHTVNKYVDELSAYKRVGKEHIDRSIENLDCK